MSNHSMSRLFIAGQLTSLLNEGILKHARACNGALINQLANWKHFENTNTTASGKQCETKEDHGW